MKNTMFRYMIAAVAVLVAAGTFTGCKTSEKNYREAYERTMARDSSRTDFDQTIYGRHRREVREGTIAQGTDTVATRRVRVTVTPDEGALNEQLKKYCVTVGEFKQLFNARSLRDRIRDAGYPGAFIVQTAEPYYYIVAESTADAAAATAAVTKLRANPPFPLRAPAPFILLPAQLH